MVFDYSGWIGIALVVWANTFGTEVPNDLYWWLFSALGQVSVDHVLRRCDQFCAAHGQKVKVFERFLSTRSPVHGCLTLCIRLTPV